MYLSFINECAFFTNKYHKSMFIFNSLSIVRQHQNVHKYVCICISLSCLECNSSITYIPCIVRAMQKFVPRSWCLHLVTPPSLWLGRTRRGTVASCGWRCAAYLPLKIIFSLSVNFSGAISDPPVTPSFGAPLKF